MASIDAINRTPMSQINLDTLTALARNRLALNTEVQASGCWTWTGAVTGEGYGSLRFNGTGWKAHRLCYLAYRGQIPHGLCVCHTCDNRVCINPDHLWIGTNQENAQDMGRKGRTGLQRHPEQAKLIRMKQIGEQHPQAKLTNEAVRAIRKQVLAGKRTHEIANQYGVSQDTISRVGKKESWSHVSD